MYQLDDNHLNTTIVFLHPIPTQFGIAFYLIQGITLLAVAQLVVVRRLWLVAELQFGARQIEVEDEPVDQRFVVKTFF